jgi:hypothetical protein
MLAAFVSQVEPLISAIAGEHAVLVSIFTQRFNDLYWWLGFLTFLFSSSFVFTAGAYVYTYLVGSKLAIIESNHIKHLKERLERLEAK